MPAPGPVGVPCAGCRVAGHMTVRHVLEWADPPAGGWLPGLDAARMVAGCRGCGSGFLDVSRRLVMTPEGGAADMPWVTCDMCQREEAAQSWAWVDCGACGAEFRASVRPLE